MFDLERSLHKADMRPSEDHVFVCGLARAGTTIAMRSLYDTGRFSSLTYRDMPFPLMPNFWQKLSSRGQRRMQQTERAHGDGVRVDYDSPEALEEVFWRVFAGDRYIGNTTLSRHRVDDDVIEKFGDYVALINLKCGKHRYLSKNNNNILRSHMLARAFPKAAIVIPFRNPLAQAASLLNQHKRFSKTHHEDPFSRKYMDWLVHHEFGSNHKRFDFGNDKPHPDTTDSDSIQYWLMLWITVYDSLLEQHRETGNVYFVCYEDICSPEHGALVWARLSSALDIPPGETGFVASNTSTGENGVESLAAEARDVYEQMREVAAARLAYSV